MALRLYSLDGGSVSKIQSEHLLELLRLIERNSTPKIQFRMADEINGVLNDDQIKILLQKTREYNHPWALVWEVTCYTGILFGELYALTNHSVNLEEGFCTLMLSEGVPTTPPS